ncbi:hypothetical protein KBB96_09320 [Luteolibacter ambystomatis]|uniref:Bacterial repeat domain-containing protein n=1 Tax=Luteolibacter ambystomatis TaxID=2824561 RepID=A0A975PGU4_9BACT|nr:hypothetical protein [Luteolibacter ambystomatis]QUE53078.1 hypothetical protein KBB96_09320 [Luteolibacter ambystomatis]
MPASQRGLSALRLAAVLLSPFALPLLPAAHAQELAVPDHTIYPPPTGKQAGILQGSAVAIAGTSGAYRLTGCPADAVGGGNAGSVKVYDSNANFLYHLQRPDVAINDRFGARLAASGNLVAVGAPGKTVDNQSGAGKVYIYDVTAPAAPRLVISPPAPTAAQNFGDSIAISGNILVVGLPQSRVGGVSNAGSVLVYDITDAAAPVLLHTFTKSTPKSGEKFGFSVAIDGRKIVVGAPYVAVGTNANVGQAFVFNLDSATPGQPMLTLSNANPAPAVVANDLFGYSTGISGNRVVIGSIYGGNSTGAVYAYNLAGSSPTVPVVLTDPRAPAAAYAGDFGATVAIYGNYLAVGAPAEYHTGTANSNSGVVYTYNLASGTPYLAAFANPAVNPQGGKLGTSVAVYGGTVMSGVPWDDTEVTDAGIAYTFAVGGTAVSRTFKAVSPTSGDRFGKSVATAGDVIAIGSPGDPTAGANKGSVRVYSRTGTTAAWTITVPPGDLAKTTSFGDAVAMAGNRIAVYGQYVEAGYSVGRVYIYNTAGNKTSPLAVIQNPQPSAMSSFGATLAMPSGGNRLIAGVHYPNGNTGGAVVYDLSWSGTTPWATLVNPTPSSGDFFGQVLAMDGDTVAISSLGSGTGVIHRYNMGAPEAERAYATATYANPFPTSNSLFGGGLALKGTRLAVGASNYSAGGITGRVYVFDLAGATPGTPVLTIPNPGPGTSFGGRLALSGELLAVGAPQNSAEASGAGRGYLYSLASATPATPIRLLKNPTPQEQDSFTNSIALEGDLFIAGAYQDRTIADFKGAAYVYDLTDSLNVAADPPAGGSVSGGGTFTIGSPRPITATPASGWEFIRWSDGTTTRSRTVAVPADDSVFTALFRPASYAAWRSYHLTPQQNANPAFSGPNATPFNDGVPNLVKFFLNISPAAPMTAADRAALPVPRVEKVGGVSYFTLTYRRSGIATDITANLQVLGGTQADSWSVLAPDLVTTTTDPATGDQTVTLKVAMAGREKRLFRLLVTSPSAG